MLASVGAAPTSATARCGITGSAIPTRKPTRPIPTAIAPKIVIGRPTPKDLLDVEGFFGSSGVFMTTPS